MKVVFKVPGKSKEIIGPHANDAWKRLWFLENMVKRAEDLRALDVNYSAEDIAEQLLRELDAAYQERGGQPS